MFADCIRCFWRGVHFVVDASGSKLAARSSTSLRVWESRILKSRGREARVGVVLLLFPQSSQVVFSEASKLEISSPRVAI